MNYLKYFACAGALALVIPISAAARDKDQQTVHIMNRVQVGNVQLNPGTYKVEWQNAGPHTKVTFLEGKKVITMVPGTLTMNDPQVTESDIVTQQVASKTILKEIDFSHNKEALIFNPGA